MNEERSLQNKNVFDKAMLIQRSAYRAGQRDILKKIKSIVETYCYGDGDICREDVLSYCNTYISETALDKEITDDIIKQIQ